MLAHFKRIYSIINKLLPNIDFEVLQQFELESRLLQRLKSHYLSNHLSYNTTSLLEEANSQLSYIALRDVTLDTSLS